MTDNLNAEVDLETEDSFRKEDLKEDDLKQEDLREEDLEIAADLEEEMIGLETFGGVISEKAEKTVASIQQRDQKFRIYNALAATFYAYVWILYFRVVDLFNMNTVTWLAFSVMFIYLLACLGFAVNSRKSGRSFSGYLIYPYFLVIFKPLIVYLAKFLPLFGANIQREGLASAFTLALKGSRGIFSNMGLFFYGNIAIATLFALLALIELFQIRKLFFSLRREHYRMTRVIEDKKLLLYLRVLGILHLLYLALMIFYYYYLVVTSRGYNLWIAGLMTIVFAFIFINMLLNVTILLKYDSYNARTGPFLFVYGFVIVLMFFTKIKGLPIAAAAALGAGTAVTALGTVYYIFLSFGVLISLLAAYLTKA